MTTIYYTVEPGNTLWGIAQYFGTTPEAIARLNGIPVMDQIYPGQKLRIPVTEIQAPEYYVVRPGDTLWTISQRFNVPMETIMQNNSFTDPNVIYPGQMIRLRVMWF